MPADTALAVRLRVEGRNARDIGDIVQLVEAGDEFALAIVREAAHQVGEVLAQCASLFDPSTIVIGGGLARLGPRVLASVTAAIIERLPPAAANHLSIELATLGERAGAVGAAIMVADEALRDRLERALPAASPFYRAAS